MKSLKHFFVLLAIGSITLTACKKDCEDHCVKTKKGLKISPAQEVPMRESNGYGTLDVSYNKCTKVLNYKINWSGLTGPIQGSHIHGTAARGVNAPVKHDFTSLISKTTSGTFSNSVTVDGIAIKEDSLLKGFYYVNLHTPKFPGGEIRGQIEF